MKHKDITILILLYNTPKNLLKNLRLYKDFKIMILDQSNNLLSKRYLKKILPNIQYYGLKKENKGFAKGQNYLIKKVRTKYFFSTQPDITLTKRSILSLKKTMLNFKDCLIAVPKISGVKNDFILNKKNKTQQPVKSMIGAAFMANTEKFIKFKMFDEDFFFYWEDVELSSRIRESNYKIYLNSKSLANHKSGTSSENNFKTYIIRNINFKYGEYLFFYKKKNLRFLKIIRQLIANLVFSLIYLLIFQQKKALKKICYFFGIMKYFLFRIKSNKKN
jgi:GT2 family glycosyltransferase